MRALSGTKEPEKIADPLIHHPSVRLMLLTQKAISEGGRSMVYECAKIADEMIDHQAAGDAKAAKECDERLGFLTPILKGFLTEAGKMAADLGIQVYGGHGYIRDNKAEQVYRDVRIAPVWEGTTQIQALDLLGRKIMRQKLQPINQHCAVLRKQCTGLMFDSSADFSTKRKAMSLYMKALEWQVLTYRLAMLGRKNPENVGAASEDYLMYAGYITLASHWLNMEHVAHQKLKSADADQEKAFYEAKIQTSQFVFDNMLPRTTSHKERMFTPLDSILSMKPEDFSFDHAR